MAEVLSQREIDALLSALSSGELSAEEIRKEETERKVRSYDFKRAMRFSKDQIRSLTRIFENFSRLLTTYFSAQLRTYVDIKVLSVEQLPYEEFISSIPKTTILNVFGIHPLDGKFVMEINPNIAYAMLDRLLGGQGIGQDEVRNLTEIETTVMVRMFGRSLDYFRDAWKGVADLIPELDMLEVNPQFMQLASPNETVAVVSLSSKIGETSGMINICMPHVVLEPVMPKLSAHYWMHMKKPRENSADLEALQYSLRRALLPVSAELGTSTITIGEFLQLTVGDVIKLDQDIKQKVQIKVGNKPKYRGQPGVSRGRIAVQVTEVLEEGVTEDDR
ncbi:flagellar motor switch protein FliM [Effusibacillus lacus]|uniref:Flagellar motor switch protein FliM n=1 Tax=Effusibacillus lacus TaxID=1348429 RepID=A0A292YP37_9BACL|nr:flagellar motor switch protein FliM [Effusibacillus lacus]TCS73128.1 flagellar motor switch protein FliM [Effusibacillus lacus]GAX90533.1 flagellar motor switch protein FliM [Effusibacillus lacus]